MRYVFAGILRLTINFALYSRKEVLFEVISLVLHVGLSYFRLLRLFPLVFHRHSIVFLLLRCLMQPCSLFQYPIDSSQVVHIQEIQC